MTNKFSFKFSACPPIKNEETAILRIIVVAGKQSTWSDRDVYPEKCQCICPNKEKNPKDPYDLTKCPKRYDQQRLYAWDCETFYEAKDQQQQFEHNKTVEGRKENDNNTPPWLKSCLKCKFKVYLNVKIIGHSGEGKEGEVYSWYITQKNKKGEIVERIQPAFSSQGNQLDSTKTYKGVKGIDGLTPYQNINTGKLDESIYLSVTRSPYDKRDDDDVSIEIEVVDFYTDKVIATFSTATNVDYEIPAP
jgi:hypothetical protein